MPKVKQECSVIKQFVAARIRDARQLAHLSQNELAYKLKVSDKTISAWELGRAEPSLDMLYQLGAVTNQPIDFFLKKQPNYSLAAKLSVVEKELQAIRKALKNKQNQHQDE